VCVCVVCALCDVLSPHVPEMGVCVCCVRVVCAWCVYTVCVLCV